MIADFFTALLILLPVTEIEEKNNLGKATVWVQEEGGISLPTPESALELFAQGKFEVPSGKKGASLGVRNHAVWFLTRVKNGKDISQHILSFQAAAIDHIELWVIRADGMQSYPAQGDHHPVSRRFYPERMANYNIEFARGEEILILYKIQSSSPMNGTIEMQTMRSYTIDAIGENALLWCVYGMIGIMLVYHIFLAVSLKSILYWLYSGFILSTLLTHMNTQGHIFQHLQGDYPELSDPIMLVYNISLICLCFFSASFLDLKKYSPRSLKVIRLMIGSCLAIGTIYFLKGPIIYNKFFFPCAFIIPLMITVIAVVAIRNGHRAARYFVLAFAVVFIGTILFMLKLLAFIPGNNLVQFSMPIGNAIQLTLMALALGDRMRLIEEEAIAAKEKQLQKEALHSEEITKLNDSLEQRVDEQTREIKSMLVSTKIGLLSLTADLSLHKDYSSHLETIVGQNDLANKNFADLILDKSKIRPDDKHKIVTAIQYTIGDDELFFDVNADCFPHEITAKFDQGEKVLALDWSPVIDNDFCVERILVSVKDITETIALRQQAEDGRRSLRYLGEIIEAGPDQFEKFSLNTKNTLTEIADVLEKNHANETLTEEEVRHIFIGLHTIKGISRFYKFSDFTDVLHLAEEVAAPKSMLGPGPFHQICDRVNDIEVVHEFYLHALEPLLKITQQKEADYHSKIHEYDVNRLIIDMEKTTDQLAKDIGKSGCKLVSNIPNGTVLTANFYEALSKTFVHLIRNSIDHGLELPEERRALGKPEQGNLRIFIDDHNRLCFEDDGRGLNLGAIIQKAQRLDIEVPHNESEIAELIFNSGFSTKDQANDVSGRGVGMDAVRQFMASVGSDITIVPVGEMKDDFMKVYFAIEMPKSLLAAA